MTLLQVVHHWQRDGSDQIGAVPASENSVFTAFEDGDTTAALWGSDDLVRIASGLRRDGLRVTQATVADFFGAHLHEEDAEEYEGRLLEVMNSGDPQLVDDFLASDRSNWIVLGVSVSMPRAGTMRLLQNGAVSLGGPSAKSELLLPALQKVLSGR